VTSSDSTKTNWGPPISRRSKPGPEPEPVSFQATKSPTATTPTAERPGIDVTADLVVGWLVIVEGSGRGTDFRLRPGMNAIGRGAGAAIDIGNGDPGISEGAHCRVTYDPRSGQFYLSPGEGNHLTYLPGESAPVLVALPLKPMQDFEIGATRIRFVPFCSTEFQWTE
jgi:hypothetical protein